MASKGAGDIVAIDEATQILQLVDGSVDLAARQVGEGRAVYVAGLPYNADNARLLHRAIYWAAGREADYAEHWTISDPRVEVAVFPEAGKAFVMNNATEAVSVTVAGRAGGFIGDGDLISLDLDLAPMASQWVSLNWPRLDRRPCLHPGAVSRLESGPGAAH